MSSSPARSAARQAGANPDVREKAGRQAAARHQAEGLSPKQVADRLVSDGFTRADADRLAGLDTQPAQKPAKESSSGTGGSTSARPRPKTPGSGSSGSGALGHSVPRAGLGFGVRTPGTAGGLLLALVLYPVFIAGVRQGPAGVKAWFEAKFLNRTATSPATPAGAWALNPASPYDPNKTTTPTPGKPFYPANPGPGTGTGTGA